MDRRILWTTRTRGVPIALALLLASQASAQGNPWDTTWDWSEQKRKITFWISAPVDAPIPPGAGPDPRDLDPAVDGQPAIGPPFSLGDAVRRAAGIWNAAGTGWTFNETDDQVKAQIEVVFTNKMAPPSQGPAGIDGTLAQFEHPDSLHITKGKIKINDKVTPWGINPANGDDFDPILVMVHELGHAMRLLDKPGVVGPATDIMNGSIARGTHRNNAKTMGPDPDGDRRNPSAKDIADATGAAEDTAKPMEKNMVVGGTVNAQPVQAHAHGGGFVSSGVMTMSWNFLAIPAGFSIWGTVVTKASSSGSAFAREVSGGVNLLTICGGNYSIHEVGTFPGGETIVADVVVSTTGDKITSQTQLTGDVQLPRLIGIQMPDAVWTPGPGPNQFTERVVKQLIREDGGPSIQVNTVATYTMASGELPCEQRRSLTINVLAADPDVSQPSTAIIEYRSTVYVEQQIPGSGPLAIAALAAGVATWSVWMLRRSRRRPDAAA